MIMFFRPFQQLLATTLCKDSLCQLRSHTMRVAGWDATSGAQTSGILSLSGGNLFCPIRNIDFLKRVARVSVSSERDPVGTKVK